VKKWAAEIVREQLGVSGCRSVIRLDKEIRREGKASSLETHYFVSSLDSDVVSAEEFQSYILGHWEVENCLHLQKDRYYDEDKHVLRLPGLGDVWTVLTSMALSLGQLLWEGERTLKEVRERCYIDPLPTARKLGWLP
jgi:predicted transposase YbfD/YdcC